MSPSYMEGNDVDINRTIRRNLSQYPLMQYISPLTSAEDLKWALTEFVNAQKLIRGKISRMLHLGTDCALQIQDAVNFAFGHEGVPVLTREQWNNALLLCVRHCEDNSWNTDTSKSSIELLLKYAPVLLHWCYAHVMNAVSKWCDSADRSQAFKLVKNKITMVIMEIVRHGCSTLDIHEMLVHVGILKYLTQKPFLTLKRSYAVTMKMQTSKNDRNLISSHLNSFIERLKEEISEETKRLYGPMKESDTMESVASIDSNLSIQFIDKVCNAAQVEGLNIWMPHCFNNQGRDLEIQCTICYGMFPEVPDDDHKQRNAISRYDQTAERKPHFIHNVPVTTKFSHVASSVDEDICLRNPMYLPEIARYMDTFVCPNAPTMSMASCRLAMNGRDAVMDNTNQAAEGGFKWLKSDDDYNKSCKSMALMFTSTGEKVKGEKKKC